MKNKNTPYHPPQKILENYAKILVNFGLGHGKGIKKGDVVSVRGDDACKPLYAEILREIWKKGGHVIQRYYPANEDYFKFDRNFFEYAHEHQLDFFPEKHMKGLADEMDHQIFILSDVDSNSLQGIDAKKIMRHEHSFKPFREWTTHKENQGKFSWTLGLYGTPGMAKDAKMSEKEYWDQIIKACFLDKKDPVQEWKKVTKQINTYISKLNKLKIEKLHIKGKDVDLWITLGKDRKWVGGDGANIPSFEIFTSPDWRGTNGWIRFSEPLYRYGNIIEGIELEFKDGVVTKSKASKNEKVLKEMINTPDANKVGEYSLTDKRFSRITKFMAETLYDENVGGKYGNTHLALGSSYHECYTGDRSKVTKEGWAKLGFNSSSVHTDIVSTTDRVVTAYLTNGKTRVIYRSGKFTL